MKTWLRSRLLVVVALSCLPFAAVLAVDPAASQSAVISPPPNDTPPAKLPYGVEDVLKLSRAQVSEDIIQNYIQRKTVSFSQGVT